MAKMIVIAMLFAQILFEATNVNVILDTMVTVSHALILTNAQQMIITAMSTRPVPIMTAVIRVNVTLDIKVMVSHVMMLMSV